MILAGTVGREKSCIALFETSGGDLRLLRSATVQNDEFPGLRPVLRRFVAQDLAALRAGCLSVEGEPPWPVLDRDLAAALGLPEVELIGPAVACAEWLPFLDPEDLVPLTPEASALSVEGIWIGLGREPGLARVSRAGAAPLEVGGDLPGICQELRNGSLAPLAAWLGGLARSAGDASLYLGGELARSTFSSSAGELRELLRAAVPPAVSVCLVDRSPNPLQGAARRAARQREIARAISRVIAVEA
ncbi:MAG TPA: hypothetical protein VN493_17845 [Thermoanaerobaculia bacterium]|nr:hypothetical protein [Thermoanaerobaculia bacterium]